VRGGNGRLRERGRTLDWDTTGGGVKDGSPQGSHVGETAVRVCGHVDGARQRLNCELNVISLGAGNSVKVTVS